MITITGLWKNKTKEGKSYMSGSLKNLGINARVMIFKNDKKEHEEQPDYNLCIATNLDKRQNEDEASSEPPGNEEELPF